MIIGIRDLADMICGKHGTVVTSGAFDPLHDGHVRMLQAAARQGKALVVLVNGNRYLQAKKDGSFMELRRRLAIVDSVRWVNYTVPWDLALTVDAALELLHPAIFAKGADIQHETDVPELATCRRIGCVVRAGLGGPYDISGSELLTRWTNRRAS